MHSLPPSLILSHALPPDDNQVNVGKRDLSDIFNAFNQFRVPHLRQILKLSAAVEKITLPQSALNTASEFALARTLEWPFTDGQLPLAAQKALELGEYAAHSHQRNSWALITLCSWQVQRAEVTFTDVASHLGITPEDSDVLLRAMSPYFLEDGITLISNDALAPGQWLAYGEVFNDLSCASVDKVTHKVIDDYLIGVGASAMHPSASKLRRLQNEMQMFLYNHPINDQRSVAINSFWISGTGTLEALSSVDSQSITTSAKAFKIFDLAPDPQNPNYLQSWRAVWEHFDSTYLPAYVHAFKQPNSKVQISLCNETSCVELKPSPHVLLRSLAGLFQPSRLSRALKC